jgi:hypothetical protein
MEVSGQHHAPAALPPEKKPGAYWVGGWMGIRAGRDVCQKRKSPVPNGLEPRTVKPAA